MLFTALPSSPATTDLETVPRLVSFTHHNSLEIHPAVVCLNSSSSFILGHIPLYGMYQDLFIDLSFQSTFVSHHPQLLGIINKAAMNICVYNCFYIYIISLFSWVVCRRGWLVNLAGCANLILKATILFPKVILLVTFLPTVCESYQSVPLLLVL